MFRISEPPTKANAFRLCGRWAADRPADAQWTPLMFLLVLVQIWGAGNNMWGQLGSGFTWNVTSDVNFEAVQVGRQRRRKRFQRRAGFACGRRDTENAP